VTEKKPDFGVNPPNPEAKNRGIRLRQAIEQTGKTIVEFAKEVGLGKTTLQNYLNGAEMQIGTAEKLASATGVDALWLIFGIGREAPQPQAPAAEISASTAPMNGYALLPRYAVKAEAGRGIEAGEESPSGFMAFSEHWIRTRLHRRKENLVVLEVEGDSMSPTINPGDLIIVDTAISNVEFSGIFVLEVSGALLVKRVHRRVDGSMSIISDNKTYQPETVQPSEANNIRVVGQVVWHAGSGI